MVFQVAKNPSDSTASNNRSKGAQEKNGLLITKPRSNRDSAECYTACGNQESQSQYVKLIDPVHIYGIGCLQDLPLTQIVQESVSYLTGKYVNTGIGTVEQEPSLMFTVINETDKFTISRAQ